MYRPNMSRGRSAFTRLDLVGHSALEVLGRAFFALQDTWTPAMAAVVALIINVVLGLTLPLFFAARGWMPHSALALATAIAALIEAGLLLWLIQRRLGNQESKALWRTVWRVCAASSVMAVVLLIWLAYAPDSTLIQVLVAVPLGLIVYIGVAILLGVDELMSTVRMVLHK